jgi:2-amino-4-hydroxy-6-hydroxymethyldihydropteridine diphosphokinase
MNNNPSPSIHSLHHTAFIGIGSNLGDRLANCRRAVELMREANGIRVENVAPWYESDALILPEAPQEGQPAYVNGAVRLATSLSPEDLLDVLQRIEAGMGRPASHPKGAPRTIDLDLLFYDGLVMVTPRLVVPHPELAKRLFVLLPLYAIASHVRDPRSGLMIRELLNAVERSLRKDTVKLFENA